MLIEMHPGEESVTRYAVILPAAGESSRFKDGNYKKPFAPLAGKAVWLHSAERFLARDDVSQLLVVISADDREFFVGKYGANLAIMGIELVIGGATRADSVKNGLQKLDDGIEMVAVHDAARPVFADVWIDELFEKANSDDAAIFASPITSTIKRADNMRITETVDRDNLWAAQTPQVFRRELLEKAHAQDGASTATDDAELVQRLGHPVTIVPCSSLNLKITTREDLQLAALALKALPKPKLEKPGNPLDDMWR